MPKPFLKWAGGKRQLLNSLTPLFPKALVTGEMDQYAEPFLGGGALFFHLAEQGLAFKKSWLCDANPELTLVYRVVQKKVEDLIAQLEKLQTEYLRLSQTARKAFYLKQREEFNRNRIGFSFKKIQSDAIWRASRFLFLNKTGYNGLWRVNQSGGFNVPFGRYAKPTLCDQDTLRKCSQALVRMKAEIATGDFQDVQEMASTKSFVYYDPPYRPVSASSSFNTYTAQGFGDAEQQRLARTFLAMHASGCLQMLSNSESKDQFFQKLYQHPEWKIIPVQARRSINSKAQSRGHVTEIVVVNYPVVK
jgi:DNA adenine methylase